MKACSSIVLPERGFGMSVLITGYNESIGSVAPPLVTDSVHKGLDIDMTAVSIPRTATGVSPATRSLQRRAHDLIPGGAHTYAKGRRPVSGNGPAFHRSWRRDATCGTWTEASTSNTAWVFAR